MNVKLSTVQTGYNVWADQQLPTVKIGIDCLQRFSRYNGKGMRKVTQTLAGHTDKRLFEGQILLTKPNVVTRLDCSKASACTLCGMFFRHVQLATHRLEDWLLDLRFCATIDTLRFRILDIF